MRKLFTISLAIILILTSATMAFARPLDMLEVAESKKSLVALGDSITTGYKIDKVGEKMWQKNSRYTSKMSYPQLIGDELGYNVNNLSISGWTSNEL